jgi:hypothetical protein
MPVCNILEVKAGGGVPPDFNLTDALDLASELVPAVAEWYHADAEFMHYRGPAPQAPRFRLGFSKRHKIAGLEPVLFCCPNRSDPERTD